jgi:hypothetical protein
MENHSAEINVLHACKQTVMETNPRTKGFSRGLFFSRKVFLKKKGQ